MSQAPMDVELYPEERLELMEMMTALRQKYSGRQDTKQNLVDFANEAENRLRALGFSAYIDISNIEIGDIGPYIDPIIEITGRIDKEDHHDFEKHAVQVQQGMEDGVAGKLVNGKLVDPTINVAVSKKE